MEDYTKTSPEVNLAITASQLVDEYPIDDALQYLGSYAYDADGSAQTLLSIYARYDWPVEEIASVLLAVYRLDQPPEVLAATIPKIKDSLLPPLDFILDDGTHAATPQEQEVIEIPVEASLPDKWNDTYPHTAAELNQRAQIAEDIALYLATGVGQLMQVQSPIHMLEASGLIEPFTRYAEECMVSNAMAVKANAQLDQLQERREELKELFLTSDRPARLADRTIDGILHLLEGWSDIMPRPSFLRHIPTRAVREQRQRDEQSIDEGSTSAQRQIERKAFDAHRYIKLKSIDLRDMPLE